jgi:hypothetical protein
MQLSLGERMSQLQLLTSLGGYFQHHPAPEKYFHTARVPTIGTAPGYGGGHQHPKEQGPNHLSSSHSDAPIGDGSWELIRSISQSVPSKYASKTPKKGSSKMMRSYYLTQGNSFG